MLDSHGKSRPGSVYHSSAMLTLCFLQLREPRGLRRGHQDVQQPYHPDGHRGAPSPDPLRRHPGAEVAQAANPGCSPVPLCRVRVRNSSLASRQAALRRYYAQRECACRQRQRVRAVPWQQRCCSVPEPALGSVCSPPCSWPQPSRGRSVHQHPDADTVYPDRGDSHYRIQHQLSRGFCRRHQASGYIACHGPRKQPRCHPYCRSRPGVKDFTPSPPTADRSSLLPTPLVFLRARTDCISP